MADLIDRDALLKDLKSDCPESEVCISETSCIECIIGSQPAVNRWISCAERLPEVYEKVLTYNDDGIIHDNFRLNLRDGSVAWSQGWAVTHWQPRPEPPEVNENA